MKYLLLILLTGCVTPKHVVKQVTPLPAIGQVIPNVSPGAVGVDTWSGPMVGSLAIDNENPKMIRVPSFDYLSPTTTDANLVRVYIYKP